MKRCITIFWVLLQPVKLQKKCLVPGKNAYLVNLVPGKMNLVLASKIIWQQWILENFPKNFTFAND